MTVVSAGGVVIVAFDYKPSFQRDYKKLTPELQEKFKIQSRKLFSANRNGTAAFEKLKGYKRPDIYTIHIEGNYKASFEIQGTTAIFRRIGNHNKIDRKP
ncbi:hypothetical protein QE250_09990 [Chromatiaceae bacterium AAb-1]|nr:hypothetical protein [Chromatiaceae bacterium AAb-1]